ncbi:hypothetical protein JCM10207_005574 [Rhodosporidiobolus poonsookiae]
MSYHEITTIGTRVREFLEPLKPYKEYHAGAVGILRQETHGLPLDAMWLLGLDVRRAWFKTLVELFLARARAGQPWNGPGFHRLALAPWHLPVPFLNGNFKRPNLINNFEIDATLGEDLQNWHSSSSAPPSESGTSDSEDEWHTPHQSRAASRRASHSSSVPEHWATPAGSRATSPHAHSQRRAAAHQPLPPLPKQTEADQAGTYRDHNPRPSARSPSLPGRLWHPSPPPSPTAPDGYNAKGFWEGAQRAF